MVKTTQLIALIQDLKKAQVELWVEDGRLKTKAPKGSITPTIRQSIKENLDDIIRILSKKETSNKEAFLAPITKVQEQKSYALSNAQRRLWIRDQMDDNLTAYNISFTLRLNGVLNINALEQALQVLFERHEVLRTRFVYINGEGRQVIEPMVNFSLNVDNVLEKSTDEIQNIAQNHADQAFDLEQEHLLKIRLLKVKEQEYLLLFNMHHIISDGWSMGILFSELSHIYQSLSNNQSIELAPLPIQYKDYAAWQNNLLENEIIIGELRQFWKNNLADIATLDLPLDYPRPAIKTYNGSVEQFQFSKKLVQQLDIYSKEQSTTLFMALTALVNILLYRYTKQTNITVGTPTAGRNHPSLHDQIGFYVNTVVLHNQLDVTDNFEAFLAKIKQTTLDAFEHELYPFDQLVEELEMPRDISRSAVFDVMISLENNDEIDFSLGAIDISYDKLEMKVSQFDLTFNFEQSDNGLLGIIEYNTDLFKKDRIERMLSHLESLIESVLQKDRTPIAELNILPKTEKNLLLETFNLNQYPDNHNYLNDKTITQLFEEQVEKTPNNIALVFEEKQPPRFRDRLTYQELNEKANQLANYLQTTYHTQSDDIIALQLERSEWIIIGILGVLKSGAAYLPIAPDLPTSRVEYMLKDSKAKALLTDTATFETVKPFDISVKNIETIEYDKFSIRNSQFVIRNSSLAYIIYTSGSTGQPKGVMIEHRNVVNFITYPIALFEITPADNIIQFSTYTFDTSIAEIFMGILTGASLFVIDPQKMSFDDFLNYIKKHEISILDLPPKFLNALEGKDLGNLRILTLGGEAPDAHVLRWYTEKYRCFNAYGPTEATVCTTLFEIPSNWSASFIPIGQPFQNVDIYIIDNQSNVCPIGVPGELCISGAGLARGYLNNPALTAEKFVHHPFQKGEKLYKTGDLARWMPDGNIEFLGRVDHQLKIRGYRIEAGEIEQTLLSNEVIQSAVVIGFTQNNETELVAYLVPKTGQSIPDIATLRAFLGESLPEYMIPLLFITLENMPLTSSGKVNRKALPNPKNYQKEILSANYAAPRNEVEQQLTTIWQNILKKEKIGIYDNFFHLGGHSLRAIRLISLIKQSLSVEIKLSEIFAQPTISALAKMIGERKNIHPVILQPIPKVTEQEDYALSNAQRRLWIPDQLEGQMVAYNMPFTYQLEGTLDVKSLEKAFETIIHRHEILRTKLVTINGIPRQVIEACQDFTLPYRDFINKNETSVQAYILENHLNYNFDLSTDYLMRVELLYTAPNTYVLLLNTHHIISDGWSNGVLLNELATLYDAYSQGETNPLSTLKIQYKDYSDWQERLLTDENYIGQLRQYWHQQLAGFQPLELPTDYPRPLVREYEGALCEHVFSASFLPKLEAISREQGTSLFVVLTGLIKVLLYKYTNQKDIIIGTGIAGRNHPDLYDQLGFYVNTLGLRSHIEGTDTFEATILKLKNTVLDAFDNDSYPFDMMVEELELQRDLSRNPIFDVSIVLQNNEEENLIFNGLKIKSIESEWKSSKFDLTFFFDTNGNDLQFTIEYSTKLFKRSRIERLITHFGELMESVFTQSNQAIDQLNILPKQEQQQLLVDFNQTKVDFPTNKTLVQLFEEQVEKTPNNTALIFENKKYTYQELNEKVNQLANYLNTTYKIHADDIIALQLERSEWMIIAMLGVMKSGAGYLPIAPDTPTSRVEYMLKDSNAKALLTDTATFETSIQFDKQISVENIETINLQNTSGQPSTVSRSPSNLAYVIYTSGSTGQPKGTLLEHGGTVNMILSQIELFELTEKDKVLQFANYIFDASVYEIYQPLFSGAALILAKKETIGNPDNFTDLINRHQVTMVTLPPVFLASLEQRAFPTLRIMVTAGEAPIQKDVAFYSPKLRYFNAFGPTECSVCISIHEVKPAALSSFSIIPIGQPIANTNLYILNKNNELQPIGIAGELCVSGAGLARGYLNNSTLTAEKFIPLPITIGNKKGERLYKTGDLARWLPDGNIEFLGRIDYQLKIRGYRIEAGEIEQTILRHPAIKQAVILGRNHQDEKVLQAFVVPEINALNNDTKEEAQDEILDNWQEVFDSSYGQETINLKDLTFDIAGWMNSYLNIPIPASEMKEWVENTSARIADLQPKKVLEVGVGTGMFLARIAPISATYFAVDLSAKAVAKVQRMINAYSELSNATVQVGAAHDLPNIAKKSLDTVVVNSVVQYFPNQGYLTKVLQELIGLTETGGHVFFGDIRSYPLLKAFHAEAQYHQMSGTTAQSVFKRALNDVVVGEKELAVHPAYFYALQEYISVPLQVDIALKEGEYWNELSQYRYDVTIKVGATANEMMLSWKSWKKENWTLNKVQSWLENNDSRPLALKNIPNARVEKGTTAVNWANGKIEAAQLGVFKAIFENKNNEAISPQAFWNLMAAYKDTYELRINWSTNANTGDYDVVILPKGQLDNQHLVFPIEQQFRSAATRKMYCNYPMQNELRQRLIIELKSYLSEQLPDYMIPQYFTPLEEMPLTPTGKIDRKALPPLEALNIASVNNYIAPRNEVETILVAIWEKVLRRTGISITDNFFDIGGHSLRAIRLVSLVKQELSVEIKLSQIFDQPTIEGLAQKVIEQKDIAIIVLQPINAIEEQENYALSNAQRRLWVVDQMEENLTAYNMPVALYLKGDLNVKALQTAFQTLIDRHEVLRTRFVAVTDDNGSDGRQVIDENVVLKLDIKEALNATTTEIQDLADAHADYVFDLESGYLINAQLLKTNHQEYVLLFNMHHIISDGWSMGILFNELSFIYQSLVTNHQTGNSPIQELPKLTIQYKDYAAWQNTLLEDEATIGALKSYWKTQLADLPTLDLPLDAPRPAVKTYNGDGLSYQFSKATTDKIKTYAKEQNATLFMYLTALVNVLFYRYSNQKDIVIGTPTAGRHHPDLHNQVGFYLNTLVLRNQIDSNETFKSFLTKVKKTALDAFEQESYPFDRLVEDLDVSRDLSRSVLFDVLLVVQNIEEISVKMDGVTVSEFPIETKVTKFDLNMHFEENEEGLYASIFYNTDIFHAPRIQRMFLHLETLVQNIFDNPNQTLGTVSILPTLETEQIVGFNSTPLALPNLETVHELFEKQVSETPNHIAVRYGENELTYQELNEKANQVAHYLISKHDIQSNDIIAFMVERSEWIMIAMLGIHKSGAAYLPLATDTPKDRVKFILEDSQTKVLLVGASLIENANLLNSAIPIEVIETIKTANSTNPNRYKTASFTPNNLASVLYTSGSTGVPKGVLMQQKAVINSLYGFKKQVYEQYSGSLQTASTGTHTFDASIRILMGSLICGHTVHLISEDLKMKGEELFEYFNLHKISITDCTPTLLNIWLNSNIDTISQNTLKHILIAGEILNTKLLTRLFKISSLQSLRLSNLYGSSEVTGASTRQDISFENGFVCLHSSNDNNTTINEKTNWLSLDDKNVGNQILPSVPVGYPMPNYDVFILDHRDFGTSNNYQLAPIGVIGEIFISGNSLAKGYVNNEALTEDKFIPHPFIENAKLYRTGDKGRWLNNGSLDFYGRIDFQLKIRGYRIEAGEIEQILLSHPTIQNAIIVGTSIAKDDFQQELVAYLLPKTGKKTPDVAILRAFLGDKLPDYMIPSHFIILDNLPLTSSGKVNRKLLPHPNNDQTNTALDIGTNYVAPRNNTEKQLATVWESILNKTNIGIHDDFFNLGGHSLKAIQLKYKIQKTLEQEIKLPSLFKYTTIEQQAIHLANLNQSDFIPADGIHFNDKNKPTVFAFPPLFGLSIIYQQLAEELSGYSVFSFDFIEDTNRIEKYYEQIKQIQPEGPYVFFGYSAGGNLAFATAAFMEEQGETIAAIIIGNSAHRIDAEYFNPQDNAAEYLGLMLDSIKSKVAPNDWENRLLDLLENDETFMQQTKNRLAAYIEFQDSAKHKKPVHADIHFLQAEGKDFYEKYKVYRDWDGWTLNKHHNYTAQGKHVELFSSPFLESNAAKIVDILNTIQRDKNYIPQLMAAHQRLNLIYLKLAQQKMEIEQKRQLEPNLI